MATVKHLLENKGYQVWTIRPDDSVFDALQEMAKRNVGALVVVEHDKVVGIFTERHYARNVFLKGRASPTTQIRDVMQSDPIYVRPEQQIVECMDIMTHKRVRHLPVLDEGKLVGIVSMGDLLKTIIADKEFNIEQLVNYISGRR